jgi:hypothetical protein
MTVKCASCGVIVTTDAPVDSDSYRCSICRGGGISRLLSNNIMAHGKARLYGRYILQGVQ